jgi:hypothetical protein
VNLVPSVEAGALFQRNEWMVSVMDKLNQGDLVLLELFKKELLKKLARKEWQNYRVVVENPNQELPYPWLEILVQQVRKDAKQKASVVQDDILVITVEKVKGVENQLGIMV